MPRLGILGTLVWDTIHRPDGGAQPFRDWGGIAYSLAAFEAAAPGGWEAVPIIKVGRDVQPAASAFLDSLSRLATREFVVPVPEPNNRVDLFYRDRSRRCERLTGGVPGWTWEELEPAVRSCDALYVNFIAGWEMNLETVLELGRRPARGSQPVYCDVHSLILGVTGEGVREPRPLARRDEWLASFDVVQVNEEELATLARGAERAKGAVDLLAAGPAGPAVLFVTLGSRGAEWWARPDSRWTSGTDAGPHDASRGALHGASLHTGADGPATPDPTGCGDVWGMTCFSALLGGVALPQAVGRANALALRCACSSGTAGLVNRLAGVELPVGTKG